MTLDVRDPYGPKDFKVGDHVYYRGDRWRILSIEPDRWDIPGVDRGEIEAVNEYGDIGLLGFADVEGNAT